MFIAGLIVGIFVGALIGAGAMALCAAAGRADECDVCQRLRSI